MGDVDLHADATRMLFSSIGTHGRWQIFEVRSDGTGLRQVTPGDEPDVDNYDPCYLPDGRIMFCSTRCFHGVPCVGGGNTVANLCRMNADGTEMRQLCFDQDHNWCPTVLNNGRVLYSRWEYSDAPHYFTRLLFHMNPDGTNQSEYYGSNSMWPNSIFYARPLPGHPTKVVAVISGHHGVPRMGELVVFDPAFGRHEAGGAVQRIPGRGRRVAPIIRDTLVDDSWPKFLHPYPLSQKLFLVACQPTSKSWWGIYLVDTFDNMVLLAEEPGYALFEPVPLRSTPLATRHSRQSRLEPARCGRLPVGCLRWSWLGRRAAWRGEATAGLRTALRVSRHGRTHQHRHRWSLGRPPHSRYRAGRGGRFGQFPRPRQYADRRATPRRRRPRTASHAQLVHRDAGRGALVRRVSRVPEFESAQQAGSCQSTCAGRHHSLVRAATRFQFPTRSATGARQVLCRLPRRPARTPVPTGRSTCA